MKLAERFETELEDLKARQDANPEAKKQLDDVDRAAETLAELGISLEPKFDISLSSRTARR